MANKIAKALGYAMMGFGGGLSGRDYIGAYLAAQKEDKPDVMEELVRKAYGLGGDIEIAPPLDTNVNTASQPLAQDAFAQWQQRNRKPQLDPRFGTIGGKIAGYDPLEEAQYKSGIAVDEAQQKTQDKELSEKYGQAGRIVGAMRNLAGYGKAMDEAGLSNVERELVQRYGQGLLPMLSTDMQKKYAPVLSYVAQQEESKIGALPILSGQARYVVDLARAIEKTIPSAGLNPETRGDLIAQSVRNMMTLVYGIENGFINSKTLQEQGIDPNSSIEGSVPNNAKRLLKSVQLTKDQKQNIEKAVDDVLGANPIKGGKEIKPKDGLTDDQAYKEYLKIIGGK